MTNKNTFRSKLDTVSAVCIENNKAKTHWRTPSPFLVSNVIQLSRFFDLIVQDWNRAVKPFQDKVDECANENAELWAMAKSFADDGLISQYLKCLFSYAFFFVSLEKAYRVIYSQLNLLNKKSFLNAKHGKPPQVSPYIKKVKNIRNISIAHVGSKKGEEADLAHAMKWQPLSIGKQAENRWDLNKICFLSGKLTMKDNHGNVVSESSDMQIEGIIELHQNCSSYLKKWDALCVNYLQNIYERLPVHDGDDYYYKFESKK